MQGGSGHMSRPWEGKQGSAPGAAQHARGLVTGQRRQLRMPVLRLRRRLRAHAGGLHWRRCSSILLFLLRLQHRPARSACAASSLCCGRGSCPAAASPLRSAALAGSMAASIGSDAPSSSSTSMLQCRPAVSACAASSLSCSRGSCRAAASPPRSAAGSKHWLLRLASRLAAQGLVLTACPAQRAGLQRARQPPSAIQR